MVPVAVAVAVAVGVGVGVGGIVRVRRVVVLDLVHVPAAIVSMTGHGVTPFRAQHSMLAIEQDPILAQRLHFVHPSCAGAVTAVLRLHERNHRSAR